MPYGDVVIRSFVIAWRHRYLWLIGFFSGESGGNVSFNYTTPANRTPDFGAIQSQSSAWLGDHVGLLVALGLVFLALAVALFILGAVCEGATIRGSAEHDAERAFGLRLAWTMGVHTTWVMVRFRLLLVALYAPLFVFVVAWLVELLVALINQEVGNLLALLFAGLVLFVVFFVYALYLLFLDRYGSRAVILEERRALAAIARAHRLLFKRFGRSLLVLVLSLAIAFALSLALAFVSALLFLPLLVAAYLTPQALIVTAIVAVPIFFVVGGFLAAQSSTYWTLAFRRVDLDYAPVAPR